MAVSSNSPPDREQRARLDKAALEASGGVWLGLLRLSDDPVYDYALFKGRLHQGLVYRSSASVAAYQELTMLAAAETQRSLMESVAKVAALERLYIQAQPPPRRNPPRDARTAYPMIDSNDPAPG